MRFVGWQESLIAAAGAAVTVGLQLLAHELDRRRRRSGKRRTRRGDWKPRSSGAAVWHTDDDTDEGDRPENGHGDPRGDR